jgi:hypothetical protein
MSDQPTELIEIMGRNFSRLAGLLLAVLLGFTACDSDSTSPSDPPITPASIMAVQGPEETEEIGSIIALTVQVEDEDGNGISGVVVQWQVSSGDGSLNPENSTTNSTGRASTNWTLGTTAGAQSVRASVSGLSPATFRTEAVDNTGLASIEITADQDTIVVGADLQLTASGLDVHGDPYQADNFEWSSSDTTTATVDENGLVTSLAGGVTTISAEADGVVGEFVLVVYGRIHDADVRSNETWTKRDSPHWVAKDILYVYSSTSPTLTIEAGAEVRFRTNTTMAIGWSSDPGTLVVEGTAADPVLLTSDDAAPGAGDWRGVDISGAATNDTRLSHLTLEYCGAEAFGACLKVNSGAQIRVDSVTVRESDSQGVQLLGNASFNSASSNLSVHNTADHAISLGANQVGTLPEGGTFSGANSRIWIKGEQVSRTQTWPNLGISYVSSGDRIWVYGPTTPILTIVEGTELRFQSGGGIDVGWSSEPGTLKVLGTVGKPVLMTSSSASPNAGSWRGIYIHSSATSENAIEHTKLAYCGDSSNEACLRAHNSTVTVNDLTIEHSGTYGARMTNGGQFGQASSNLTVRESGSYPVRIDANRVGTLPLGGDYTNNGATGIFIESGTVSRSQTWNDPGVPYVVGTGILYVYDSTEPTLTLAPGLEFRMSSGSEIQVGWSSHAGTLISEGTAGAPIVFTANSNSPQAGHWKGIDFSGVATLDSRISHTTVEYGTNNLYFRMVPGGLEGLTIRGASECGVRFDRVGSPPDLQDPARSNTFENNATDICS